MSWNGSDKATASPSPRKGLAKNAASRSTIEKSQIEKSKNLSRLLLAGLITLALAGAVVWWFSTKQSSSTPHAQPQVHGTITEVKPQIATNAAPVKSDVVEFKHIKNGKYMKYVNGEPVWSYPRYKDYGPSMTVKVSRAQSFVEKTFKNRADRQIASLLRHHPGDKIIGNPRYEVDFKENFLKSLMEPELPNSDDTPEQKQLKRDVAEVKSELKARMDAGEDIAKIMSETRQKFRELSVYKRELEAEVSKHSHDEGVSAEDLKDFVVAANKMLEARGIEPFKIDGFLKNQMMYMKRQQSKKEQEK